jgi:hypothetical protein
VRSLRQEQIPGLQMQPVVASRWAGCRYKGTVTT